MTTMTMTDPAALVGFVAFDSEGEQLGEIEGVYLGAEEPEWAAVLVDAQFVIVPLHDAEIYEDSIDLPFTAAEVRDAPLQQGELLEDLTEEQEDELIEYFAGGESLPVSDAGTEVATTDEEQGQEVASTTMEQDPEVAATVKEQGQEVASAAKEHGQQVASTAKEQGQRVASTVKEQGSQVLRSTADQAGEVVGTAKQQAGEVAQQASTEARNLLEETRMRLEEQTVEGTRKLGENLSRLGTEALALAEGRPEEAPTVQGYVRRAGETLLDVADRAHGISDDVQTRGLGGVLSDVQSFARRRPGVFLLGAAVVGVVAGRAVRNAKDEDGQQEMAALPPSRNGQHAPASNGRAR